ncbi:SDR family oxidoreductase [Oryzifoliimicrobium ureilyticus]|uniref:SDR family oxidoreductase n=1 Tax=Oryzifoliimicrobium ureilyticus TaxID=3113724 RepID=UPI0030763774
MGKSSFRTALVTGSAKRVGRAIIEDLAKDGFSVAIHANGSLDEAEQIAAALRQQGKSAIALRANLSDQAEAENLLEAAADALGPVDLLVNNASVFENDSADTFDAQAFDRHFSIHVRAPSILSAKFARMLPEDAKGMIVNIVDQRVWSLTPFFYSYTLSKAALWTATQTMAQSFAPRIRVNAIGPGPTIRSERQSEEDFKAQVDGLIMKAGPRLEEFGRAIRFLYETPSITGQMIALDGGQHLAWQTPDVAEIRE